MELSREEYTRRYGPTTGDLVRLGDTDLRVRVEADDVGYGDEPMWGFAKNWRSRQAQYDRATGDSDLDLVLAGVVMIDPVLGVRKTNIGVKDGRIVGIGRAGNPDITDGVDLVIGPNTWPGNAYGLIATAGAIDSHVHAITPPIVPAALSAGVTTLITAGFEEPPYFMDKVYRAFENLPVNLGLQASARTDVRDPVEHLIEVGACGLKVHEDWGAYPEIIDATLSLAQVHDVSVCLHTDGLNESAELEDTVAAIGGRAIHAYHVEGTGGGHFPDVIGLVREPNVICSSVTPTIPFGRATAAEHLEMILAVHGGSVDVPEDVAAARERIHEGPMAAEGPLQDMGAISIINSDSQGMGRIGETVRRTWQLAHVMKAAAGQKTEHDNERVLRYLEKYTTAPAITHGIEGEVGSLQPGRLADIVLWEPAYFGVKPLAILKAGYFAWGALGTGNASVEMAQPVIYGPHWGAMGGAAAELSTTFVSSAAIESGIQERLGSRRRFVPVSGSRAVKRSSLARNGVTAPVEVDPRTGVVSLNGEVLGIEPVAEVPLNRRYILS